MQASMVNLKVVICDADFNMGFELMVLVAQWRCLRGSGYTREAATDRSATNHLIMFGITSFTLLLIFSLVKAAFTPVLSDILRLWPEVSGLSGEGRRCCRDLFVIVQEISAS
jgi:hypothetical protein